MLKALIVDDEISHVQGLIRFIDWQELGFGAPAAAESGEEALQLLQNSSFDVLVSDVSMPGMTGIELAAEAKRLHPHIQILMISGYNEFEFVQDAIHVGAQAYVLKPLKTEEVAARLQTFRDSLRMRMEVMEQTRELEKKVSESVRLVKERFVSDLVADAISVTELLDSWREMLPVPALERGYRVIVVGLDRYLASGLDAKQRMRLAGGFKKTVEIGFSHDEGIWLAQTAPDEFAALHLNPSPAALALTEKQFAFIQTMMGEQYEATVTIGCSDEGQAWEEAPLLYKEIRFGMAKARLAADGQIVRGAEAERGDFEAYRMREEFVPGLLRHMETGDSEQAAQSMDSIKDALLAAEAMSFSYAQAFGMSILSELIRSSKERSGAGAADPIVMWRQMLDCGSAAQMAELLAEFVRQHMAFERKTHLNQQHHLIRNVSQFIEERLRENWTVKQLAEQFNLNASYLSVLFKKETGRTISEFVQITRIKRAKELLQDPNVKVYEVADEVGIQTTAYFTYLFKKLVGSTPQEYRDYGYSADD
ncbi:two-component system response regulator YesN [Cohnella sp. SGD-V74]|nr:two-component system response regulator YesN [Cohnella sp. SGD-V74]